MKNLMKTVGALLSPKKDKKQKETIESNGFQIRHSTLGVYQGLLQNFYYWFPKSQTPELGIFRFNNIPSAEAAVLELEEVFTKMMIYPGETFIIEPWDGDEHRKMLAQGDLIKQASLLPPGRA